MNNTIKKIVATITGLALAATMAPGLAQALTAEELQDQIDALLAQLQTLQSQLAQLQGTTPTVSGCTITSFDRNLKLGMTGDDVKCLQIVLNSDAATQLAASGVGSAGNETSYFGPLTQAAVVKFQEKYAEDCLASWGLTSGTGFVGSTTRAKLNTLLGAVVLPTGCTTAADCPTGYTCTAGACVQIPVGAGLTVALAADTPASTSLVTDVDDGSQALAPLVKFNFSNGTGAEVKVTTLKLTRTGIATDADLANVYLYDGSTRLAEMTSVANRVYTFTNAAGLFSIPVGSIRGITVRADLTDTSLSGKTIALGINAATDIVTDSLATNGTFPMSGNMMSTAVVTDIGRLEVGTTVTAPASVDPGVAGREILRFNMAASNQDLSVSYIKFTNVGTIANTDLANLNLMDGATQLGTTLTSLAADNTAVFDLSAAPLTISSGATKSLTVTADVVGGTNRNFKLTIQRQSDIVVKDTNYGINVKPFTNATTETFSVIQPAAATNVNVGTLAITIDSASPSGNVALNSTNIELARFKFVASGEAVKVLTLPIQLTLTTATNLKNVRLVLDGTQVGSTLASLATGTPTTFPTSGDFGNSFVIPAGTTGKVLSIKADVASASGAGDPLADTDTIVAQLNAGSTNAQGQISYTSISTSAANGRLLTVATGALTAAKNLAVADGNSTIPNGVKGATVKIGSFVLTAGAGEGVSVSQIQVTDSVASTTVATTTHDTIANGAGVSITVASTTPFVVGESYYISRDATPTVDYATITVTSISSGTVMLVTVSGLAGTGDMSTGQALTIRSAAGATDTLADTFQNLRLMMGATQVGTAYSSLTDTASTVYTFTPATAISITAGQQVVFDVLADAKNVATTLSVNSDASGIITHTLTTAVGLVTSGNANTTGASNTLTLQNVYIAGAGSMTVAVNADTPISQQVVMGTVEVELARFKLSEITGGENLSITQIVVLDTVSSETHGTVQNIHLMDGSAVLGTVATLVRTGATTGTATFSGLNITVPRGGNKVLTVKANITTFPGGTSGSTHLLSVASFVGTGASSGNSLTSSASTGTAGTMTAYRTKISVAHATDSPSGASSGSLQQIVAKYVISNSANAGNYDATLEGMTVNMGSTITNAANSVKYITFFKTTVSGSAPNQGNSGVGSGNALASIGVKDGSGTCTTAAQLTCVAASPAQKFTNTAIADAAFTDVTIASGSFVTIIVVADTDNAATGNNFSAGISSTGVEWGDGVSASLTSVDTLPITGKTLTY